MKIKIIIEVEINIIYQTEIYFNWNHAQYITYKKQKKDDKKR